MLKDGEVLKGPPRPEVRPEPSALKVFLHDNSRAYRFFGEMRRRLRPAASAPDPEARRELVLLAEALLAQFAEETGRRRSALLIVVIPDVNEWASPEAREVADVQRALLEDLAKRRAHVHVLDLRPALEAGGVADAYGADGHLNRFGQYLVAKAVAASIGVDAPEFDPRADLEITPDCALADSYRARLGLAGR